MATTFGARGKLGATTFGARGELDIAASPSRACTTGGGFLCDTLRTAAAHPFLGSVRSVAPRRSPRSSSR
jgi:hypothetical protein